MAQTERRRLPENIVGEFYVDDSCIDCDACRQIAPATFHDHGGQSSVYRQPRKSLRIAPRADGASHLPNRLHRHRLKA